MNNTTEYIDAMPLSDIEKAALPKSDIRAVHTALDGDHHEFTRDDDTPLGSVKARLEQASLTTAGNASGAVSADLTEVDALSGATITSSAVTTIVNNSYFYVTEVLSAE